MSTRRICIITPNHLSRNPRVVKEAEALAAAGHDVHVVHGRYEPTYDGFDRAMTLPFGTTVVPWGPFMAPRGTYLRQGIAHRLSKYVSKLRPLLGPLAVHAAAPAAPDLMKVVRDVSADLYIAHYVAALPAAAEAAARHGAIYAFDAEDFHLGDLPDAPEHRHANAIIREIEGRYLPGAAYVTAGSPGIADAYAKAYGIETPHTILNVFPTGQAPAEWTPRGATPHPSVYWFSQTIGADRGLEQAIEAIAIARTEPHLYLRGTPASGYLEELMAFAGTNGVADRVHVLPPDEPERMVRLATEYDVGLVAETGRTRNHRIMLSNKQFTFILAGVPLLMSDIPSHREFAAQAGHAARLFRIEDPSTLAAGMDALLQRGDALSEARQQAFRLGQTRYNWELEGAKLIDIVEEALNG